MRPTTRSAMTVRRRELMSSISIAPGRVQAGAREGGTERRGTATSRTLPFRIFHYIRIFRNVDGAMAEFAPIAKTNVYPKAEFTASDLKRGGAVLEAASDGKVVRIMRRDTGFLLIREDHVMALVAALTDTTPKSLEQMLEGFSKEDAMSLRERMTAWRADAPVGKELL